MGWGSLLSGPNRCFKTSQAGKASHSCPITLNIHGRNSPHTFVLNKIHNIHLKTVMQLIKLSISIQFLKDKCTRLYVSLLLTFAISPTLGSITSKSFQVICTSHPPCLARREVGQCIRWRPKTAVHPLQEGTQRQERDETLHRMDLKPSLTEPQERPNQLNCIIFLDTQDKAKPPHAIHSFPSLTPSLGVQTEGIRKYTSLRTRDSLYQPSQPATRPC